jgi:hypothetical protein
MILKNEEENEILFLVYFHCTLKFFLQTGFIPPSENGIGISRGAMVGIVVAGAFVIFSVLGILWWKCCLGQKNKMEQGI